jgi:hypothetical protein
MSKFTLSAELKALENQHGVHVARFGREVHIYIDDDEIGICIGCAPTECGLRGPSFAVSADADSAALYETVSSERFQATAFDVQAGYYYRHRPDLSAEENALGKISVEAADEIEEMLSDVTDLTRNRLTPAQYKVLDFEVPDLCCEDSVNAALRKAGLDAYIYRDGYNNNMYSIMMALPPPWFNASSPVRTWCTTAREIADKIACGEFDIEWLDESKMEEPFDEDDSEYYEEEDEDEDQDEDDYESED